MRIKTNDGHIADLSDVDKKINLQSSGGQTITIDDAANKITVQTGRTPRTEVDGIPGTITLSGTNVVLSATERYAWRKFGGAVRWCGEICC